MDLSGIIVGLGNPGAQYRGTRHNVGFMAVHRLLEELQHGTDQNPEQLSGAKFHSLLWRIRIPNGGVWLLAEPQTFMNLSGEAVQSLVAWYGFRPEQILVVHDDLDLEPGRLKLKKGGGAAGHKGVTSIEQRLGSPEFYRLRVGIGKPENREQVNAWVLGRFSDVDKDALEDAFLHVVDAILCFAIDGPERAISVANTRRK